ncbi:MULTISPECIES: DUF1697 domain-containing protein [Devosia]|uniref:DUF1697 domain-containing protein n=1 Tax=Devosia TaxID=46913 RepID=UPI000CE99752|nr:MULTISPECIES: DUF1697 domain-containing protein [Devosia]AVF02280.1 hypothetical protein C4375_00055 [Devosia sp. I507]
MATSPPLYAILLRAIGPATHKLMGMAQWRAASEAAGFIAPETLVNTGNMIAQFDGSPAAARQTMTGVLRQFGLGENVVPILRTPAQLKKLLRADPIADAAQHRPAETGVYFFAAAKPDLGWISDHGGPEMIHVIANHLIVDFSQDVAKSGKLIRRIDKQCGLNTARNWNTTRKLAERSIARGKE